MQLCAWLHEINYDPPREAALMRRRAPRLLKGLGAQLPRSESSRQASVCGNRLKVVCTNIILHNWCHECNVIECIGDFYYNKMSLISENLSYLHIFR